jgi:hypothetical protein
MELTFDDFLHLGNYLFILGCKQHYSTLFLLIKLHR